MCDYPFDLKVSFWAFQRCSLARFDYKENFGQSRVKITE